MTREEILKKSQEENRNRDYVEKEALGKSFNVSFLCGVFAVGLVLLLAGFADKDPHHDALFIFFSMETGIFFSKYFRLRKTHELVLAIVYAALTIIFLVLFCLQLAGRVK